jgi:hypothetical protein
VRRPSSFVAWTTGVGGVLLIAYNILDAYTTLLGFASPNILTLLGTPVAWVLLFICFCTLWWRLRHPNSLSVDGVLYREVIRLRQENDSLRRTVTEFAPRRLTEQQRNSIRTSLGPVLEKWGRGPQISIFWTGAGDTADYAKQFEELLESIGFRMLRVSGPGIYSGLKHDYHYGVWVRHDSKEAIAHGVPSLGSALVAALDNAGVADVIEFDWEGHRILELIVGAPYRTEADLQRQRDERYVERER